MTDVNKLESELRMLRALLNVPSDDPDTELLELIELRQSELTYLQTRNKLRVVK